MLAAGIGLWGLHKAREIGEQMADSEERTSKALQILGAEEIPDGYHPLVAFSVPFVLEAVVLSHLPPDEQGGRTTSSCSASRTSTSIEERVSRGALSRERDEILWACHRGSVESEETGRSQPGLVTILLIDCDDEDADEVERFFGGIRPCS